MPAIERLRAALAERRHLRDRRGGGRRPDPSVDARRRQRVLHLAAARGDASTRRCAGRPRAAPRRRRRSTQATTLVFFGAKGGAGTTTLAVNCARRDRAAEQAADGHRRPEAGPRRGRAVPRRAQPLHAARRARQPAPARPRVPARSWSSSTSPGSRFWPARITFDRPGASRQRRARRGVPAAGAPVRVHRHRRRQPDELRARWRRSTPPTRSSWSPTPTCRRCATRSGCSIASASSGACGERVRVLLNRAAEPYPIPPKQIESALGHPISPHVPERLQDRVDGAQLRRAAGADRQHRASRRSSTASRARILDPDGRGADRQRRPSAPARPRAPGVDLVTDMATDSPAPPLRRHADRADVAARARSAGAAPAVPRAARRTCTASCSTA